MRKTNVYLCRLISAFVFALAKLATRHKATCIKGLFPPPSGAKKLKVVFHQFLLICLLGEEPECKILAFI